MAFVLVGEPWDQIGPPGRLLLIPAVALADQSRVMQGNLEPLLELARQRLQEHDCSLRDFKRRLPKT